jgi:hypothetical protein
VRECYFDLVLAGSPLGFGARTTHGEMARRTPTKVDRLDIDFIAGVSAAKG